MKIAVIVLAGVAAVAALAAGAFATLYFTDESGASAAACGDRSFGHIASLKQDGDGYWMRFDPAWFTSGVTANEAAARGRGGRARRAVPNDNYRIEEGHRLLTYLVPADTGRDRAHAEGDPESLGATAVTVDQLGQLVAGEAPVELFESLDTGVWIRVNIDTVCSIDQQYVP